MNHIKIPKGIRKRKIEAYEILRLYGGEDIFLAALATLPSKLEKIIRMRTGIGGNRTYTMQEIADQLGCTKRRIGQLEDRALCLLNHPARSKILNGQSKTYICGN